MRDTLHEPTLIGHLTSIPDKQTFEEIYLNIGLRPSDFSDRDLGTAYDVIRQCWEDDLIPSPKVVHTKSAKKLPIGWLEDMAKADPIPMDEAITRAQLIVEESERRNTSTTLVNGLKGLQDGKTPDTVKDGVMQTFARRRGINIQDAKAATIFQRAGQMRERGLVVHVTPTRMEWMDRWLKGGLRSNRFLAIAGPQGGRKSTWARNLVLGVLRDEQKRPRQNVTVAWLGYENDQQITAFDFASMLGIEWLNEVGKLSMTLNGASGKPIPMTHFLDAENLQRRYLEDAIKDWHEVPRQAANVGIERASYLNLSIYDSTAENGGLVDRTALHRVIRKHHWDHVGPSTHFIVVIDYAQLVRQTGRIFEDMVDLSTECLQLVQELNCTIILLSQYNEDTNREHAQGNTGYIGLKGGGDLRASVQNLMIVEYSEEADNSKLKVRSAKGRRGGSVGGDVYRIEPVSGLILGRFER